MEVIAITRNARMSAFKGRPLCRACQGLKASDALKVVEFSPKKAAEIIKKTIMSAIANAKNNNGVKEAGDLTVKLCVLDEEGAEGLLGREPTAAPGVVHADAEADRINFLSHYLLSFLASVRTTLQWHMRRAIGWAEPRAVGQ